MSSSPDYEHWRGWNLQQNHTGSEHVTASKQSVEGGDKCDPTTCDLRNSRHQKRGDADYSKRHEQNDNETVPS